jgi:hypothetical protein
VATLLVHDSNLIIVGAWNPAIISPFWLHQQFPDLLPGEHFDAEFLVQPTVSVRFKINDIQIDPSNGRLTLSPATNDEERLRFLPRLAHAISERLPHTPVIAMGFNFVFRVEANRRLAIDKFLDERGQGELYAGLGLATRTGRQVTHSFALTQGMLNITYEYRPDETKVNFNFHHAVTGGQQVRDVLPSFAERLEESRRLANVIDAGE